MIIKQLKLKSMKKLKKIAVAVASLVLFSNITNAQTLTTVNSVTYEEPLKVKYLGEDGEYLRFEVTFQPGISSKALFAIEERKEGELYSSFVGADFKVQKIKIEKGDYRSLNFKLFNGKKTYSKSFSVNTSLVETTTVSESDLTKL